MFLLPDTGSQTGRGHVLFRKACIGKGRHNLSNKCKHMVNIYLSKYNMVEYKHSDPSLVRVLFLLIIMKNTNDLFVLLV